MISKSSSAVLAILASSAVAYTPASSDSAVCNLVTETYTGPGVWVPDPTAWGPWDPSKSTTSSKSSSTSTESWGPWDPSKSSSTTKVSSSSSSSASSSESWGAWDPSKSTKTTTTSMASSTDSWGPWDPSTSTTTSKPTSSSTSVYSQWSEWSEASSSTSSSSKSSSSSASTTKSSSTSASTTQVFRPTTEATSSSSTTKATTTSSSTTTEATTTASTTTAAAKATATCPADNGKTLAAGGSCGCDFQINCDVRGDTSGNPQFWSGAVADTLAECNQRCDDNSDCQATLWVEDPTSSDYHLCWQIAGSFPVSGTGYARISYKGACSGSCSSSYNS